MLLTHQIVSYFSTDFIIYLLIYIWQVEQLKAIKFFWFVFHSINNFEMRKLL